MGAIRGRFVPTVAVSLSLFVWTRAEVATESPLRLPLYVYDYAGVAPDVRAAAAEVTRHIYAAIGVDVVWVDRCPLACHIAFTQEAQADTTGWRSDGHHSAGRHDVSGVSSRGDGSRKGRGQCGVHLFRQNQGLCTRT